MSRVFVAEELRLERKVVVKVLSPDLAQGLSVDRFEREIRTVAALQQANIVPVLTAGDTDGLPFYTMPFVEGESLRVRLARGPLVIADVVGVMRDVSKALAYAHQRGVVHRDIKPDNVLLSGGTAVVTDFGIAKAISAARTESENATLTQIGTSIGTPAYMAPEQAAGDANIDHRADLYSLGAMAYELLSGKAVFADRTPQRMLAAHMSEAARPVTDLRPDTPATLADLVMKCLAKEPSQRPQDAGEVLRSLETTSGGGMAAMPPVLLGGPGMFRKALAIYAAAFVVVAVLAKAAIVGIGLPDWVFPGSLILMALGLPVVLWTGYVQRVTRRALTQTPTFTPGGTPSLVHGTMATMAFKAAPHVSWYRTARGGMYAFGTFIVLIAAFMGMRASGIGPFGSLVASGKLRQKEPLLLTDFRVTNADSSLGRVVSDAVRAGLAESSVLSVLSPASISAAMLRSKRGENATVDLAVARDLAAREGVKAIVDGDVTGVGSGYIVQLRLISADSATVLVSFRETGEGSRGLIDAADKLARAFRGRAGESLRAIRSATPLAEATTGSLDALRKYTEAWRAGGAGHFTDAVRLTREAVAIDSGFALAYRDLASYINDGGMSAAARDSAITRAFQLRDRLSERERQAVIGDYNRYGPGRDRAKAIDAYDKDVKLGDYSNTNDLGIMLETRREFARAESLGLARIRLDPKRAITYSNLVGWQLEQGRTAAAESTLALAKRNGAVELPEELVDSGFIAGARGDAPRAVKLLDSAARISSEPRGRVFFRQLAAEVLDNLGRIKEGDRELRDAAVVVAERGMQTFPAGDSLSAIQRDASLFGAPAAYVLRVDAVVGRPGFAETRAHLAAASTYAMLGRADKAKAMLAKYDADVRDTAFRRVSEPDRHNTLAFVALAEHRPLDAVPEFRRGDVQPDGPATNCAGCLPNYLARAFDAAGVADSAIAQIETFLRVPVVARGVPLATPLLEERLAQLYEAKGNAEKAAEHYRAFIEIWKNADPELQPRVAEARRRLLKLTPVEKPKR